MNEQTGLVFNPTNNQSLSIFYSANQKSATTNQPMNTGIELDKTTTTSSSPPPSSGLKRVIKMPKANAPAFVSKSSSLAGNPVTTLGVSPTAKQFPTAQKQVRTPVNIRYQSEQHLVYQPKQSSPRVIQPVPQTLSTQRVIQPVPQTLSSSNVKIFSRETQVRPISVSELEDLPDINFSEETSGLSEIIVKPQSIKDVRSLSEISIDVKLPIVNKSESLLTQPVPVSQIANVQKPVSPKPVPQITNVQKPVSPARNIKQRQTSHRSSYSSAKVEPVAITLKSSRVMATIGLPTGENPTLIKQAPPPTRQHIEENVQSPPATTQIVSSPIIPLASESNLAIPYTSEQQKMLCQFNIDINKLKPTRSRKDEQTYTMAELNELSKLLGIKKSINKKDACEHILTWLHRYSPNTTSSSVVSPRPAPVTQNYLTTQ